MKNKKLLSIVLCVMTLTAISIAGCKNQPPEDSKTVEESTDSGSGAIVNGGGGAGMKIAIVQLTGADYESNGISANAENAYSLTATIEPSNATNKAVDWSVSFVDESSAWATGKMVTDYVTVMPTSDGALTASVACIKAFGSQIRVTCVSRDNEAAKAECTVDYKKRLLGAKGRLSDGTEFDVLTAESFTTTSTLTEALTINYTYTYSDYTIDAEVDLVPQLRINGDVFQTMKAAIGASVTISGAHMDLGITTETSAAQTFTLMKTLTYESSTGLPKALPAADQNKVSEWLKNNPESGLFRIQYVYAEGGVANYCNINLSSSSFVYAVESVNVNNSALVF